MATSEPRTNGTATSSSATNETVTNGTVPGAELSSEGAGTSSGNDSTGSSASGGGTSNVDTTSTTDDGSTTSTTDASTSASTQGTSDDATSTGGSSVDGDCSPDPGGDFVTAGDVVFDEKTCLSWMKSDVNGHPYAAADAYCADLTLGGYDDWRLPTAGEATTLFHCLGTFPPVYDVFTATYDGIWTTTETGTIAGDEPKVCGAGQASGQFYDFGKVGAQNTRCVRGPVTVADRADCKTNNQVCQ